MEFGSLHQQFEIKIKKKSVKKTSGFVNLINEGDSMVYLRQGMYQRDLSMMDQIIKDITQENNRDCVHQVLNFLKTDQPNLITTAVVLGGHSGSDRESFYNYFKSLSGVNNEFTPLSGMNLAILENIDSLKQCIKDVIDQFIGGEKNDYCDFDIQKLVSWYRSLSHKPRLVIVIPDFEGFDMIVLGKLIQILSARISELPICFVIGVATTIDSLNQHLSQSAFCFLNTKLFRMKNSRDCISQIIDQVLLSSGDGLKLGLIPFRGLMDRFVDRDLSIESFARGLKYALMCHYYGNPLSVFMHEDVLYEQDLLESHFDGVRALLSFRNYVDHEIQFIKNDKEKAVYLKKLLTDNDFLLEFIGIQVDTIKNYNLSYGIVLKLLFDMQTLFKTRELKKSLLHLYETGLHEDLFDHDHVKMCLFVFRKLDKTIIRDFILKTIHIMSRADARHIFKEFIADLEKILNELTDQIHDEEEFESDDDDEKVEELKEMNQEYVIKMGLKRAALELQATRKTKSAKKAGFESLDAQKKGLLSKITIMYTKIFTTFLKRYTHLLLHEICYFIDSGRLLSKTFHAEPRAVIHTALNASQVYIGCDCCESNKMSSTLEDISILYHLYQECGRLINLQDWFDAFKVIISQDGKSHEAIHLQSRFTKGVHELQFLGFIKPTGRKKDHVQRLTWGS